MIKKILFVVLFGFGAMLFSGCSTKHTFVLNKNYMPKNNARVEVETVSNKTSQNFGINVEDMLEKSLIKKLEADGMLWVSDESPKLQLNVDILEYSEGDAFKRWIMPGWGATVLIIEATLKDDNQVIGKAYAARSIGAGGGFTIGAWKYVYDDISADIITDLKEAYSYKLK